VAIQFDKPRSITPEAICRDLRESRHCQGMEILLWDEEITVEDRKSGTEITIKLESSKVEVESGGGKKEIAEKVATALVGLGLRRRGLGKEKKVFRGRGAAPAGGPAPAPAPEPPPAPAPSKPAASSKPTSTRPKR
jgi:hypothetical protein